MTYLQVPKQTGRNCRGHSSNYQYSAPKFNPAIAIVSYSSNAPQSETASCLSLSSSTTTQVAAHFGMLEALIRVLAVARGAAFLQTKGSGRAVFTFLRELFTCISKGAVATERGQLLVRAPWNSCMRQDGMCLTRLPPPSRSILLDPAAGSEGLLILTQVPKS